MNVSREVLLYRIAIGFGLLGMLALGWQTTTLSGRVQTLEQAAQERTERRATRERTGRGRGNTRRGSSRAAGESRPVASGTSQQAADVLAVDLEDPEAVAAIEDIVTDVYDTQRDERSQRREEYVATRVQEEVEAFGEETGLDDERIQALTRLLVDGSTQQHALRDSAMNGDISWEQMRDDRETIRDEITDQLVEMLGEEEATALAERIRWLGRGR